MKKSIINLAICATIMSSSWVFAATDQMFNNTDSKEWGSTPSNVKNALKDIKVMSGSSTKDMMSKNWLNELKRSPSTYNLNQGDVAWINGMINGSKGDSWNPKTKVSVTSDKKSINNKDQKDLNSKKEIVKSEPTIAPKTNPVKENVKTDLNKKNNVINEKPIAKLSKENSASKEKNDKDKIAKLLAENEKKNKIDKLNSDIETLKVDQKVLEETEKTEVSNRNIYNEQILKLSNLNNVNLILQNDKNYQDTIDGTDKLKDMIKETNESLLNQQSTLNEESSKLSLEEKDLIKNNEVSNENKNKESLNVENANKVVKEVSNSINKTEIVTNLIKEDINKKSKIKNTDMQWKKISIYIILGFSLLIFLFMGFIGFNKKEGEDK